MQRRDECRVNYHKPTLPDIQGVRGGKKGNRRVERKRDDDDESPFSSKRDGRSVDANGPGRLRLGDEIETKAPGRPPLVFPPLHISTMALNNAESNQHVGHAGHDSSSLGAFILRVVLLHHSPSILLRLGRPHPLPDLPTDRKPLVYWSLNMYMCDTGISQPCLVLFA